MGTNRANPTAMVLSATMLLRHLGYVFLARLALISLTVSFRSLDSIANSIASATFDVINAGEIRTADMGGEYFPMVCLASFSRCFAGAATTSEFTSAIIKKL